MINAKYKLGEEVSFKIIGDYIVKGVITKIVEEKDKIKYPNFRELNNLDNGYGLKIFFDKNDSTVSVGRSFEENIINRVHVANIDEQFVLNLKSMGFDLDKPKTIKSILEELWKYQKDFEKGEPNYYMYLYGNDKEISFDSINTIDRIGMKYFDKEKLITAIQELEEINAGFEDIIKCIKEM